MAFHELQFPVDISFGSSGGPEFKTEIVVKGDGKEQRNIDIKYARHRYNIAYGVKRQVQLQALLDFFYNRKGRRHDFRFKDWLDYSMAAELIGVGDNSETEFQIIKAYSSGAYDYVRVITKPVPGSVVVYLDDVEQVSGWSVNTTTGIITFSSPPGTDVEVSVDCDFDVPVRFDLDHLPMAIEQYGSGSALNITIIEVKI